MVKVISFEHGPVHFIISQEIHDIDLRVVVSGAGQFLNQENLQAFNGDAGNEVVTSDVFFYLLVKIFYEEEDIIELIKVLVFHYSALVHNLH